MFEPEADQKAFTISKSLGLEDFTLHCSGRDFPIVYHSIDNLQQEVQSFLNDLQQDRAGRLYLSDGYCLSYYPKLKHLKIENEIPIEGLRQSSESLLYLVADHAKFVEIFTTMFYA